MSDVAKVIELVGSSEKSWEDAAQNAVKTAAKTLHGISGVEVTNMTAKVEDGKIVRYKTTVKVAFAVES
ncbi:MAG: dodecin domain-containing protein [Caldilineae bacterium]|nr:MAG: dodecin domain-containing protein [Caldilineae bacterium]